MSIHEECGEFGVYDPAGDCARSTYYGLYALQHRGQEACGIATINNRELSYHKDLGLVGDVFQEDMLDRLNGTMAVGHVRYATTGGGRRENAQPLTLKYVKGTLAVAHNGNLVNTDRLRTDFEYKGAIFQTSTDSEIIAYAIAHERLRCPSAEKAVSLAMNHLSGAYSLIVMSARKLIAARDPWGFRPLCMGRRGEAVFFASETCALDSVGASFEREIEPGEIVVVEEGRVRSIRDHCEEASSHMCIFEYIYFARPDSVIAGQSVHEARVQAGRLLAREYPVQADLVIGVPDSGLDAAMGYAMESGIPYGKGFVKNRYIGRTFITPDQQSRENAVHIKLSPLRSEIAGKRVVMIDDSIVRGTTSKQIVGLLRDAGAREVHMRVSAPPFIAPCYFGTDIPDQKDLIACKYTIPEITDMIGADSLAFLSQKALYHIAPNASCGFCDACFTAEYPIQVQGAHPQERLRGFKKPLFAASLVKYCINCGYFWVRPPVICNENGNPFKKLLTGEVKLCILNISVENEGVPTLQGRSAFYFSILHSIVRKGAIQHVV